jgi:hypothetical protein
VDKIGKLETDAQDQPLEEVKILKAVILWGVAVDYNNIFKRVLFFSIIIFKKESTSYILWVMIFYMKKVE